MNTVEIALARPRPSRPPSKEPSNCWASTRNIMSEPRPLDIGKVISMRAGCTCKHTQLSIAPKGPHNLLPQPSAEPTDQHGASRVMKIGSAISRQTPRPRSLEAPETENARSISHSSGDSL